MYVILFHFNFKDYFYVCGPRGTFESHPLCLFQLRALFFIKPPFLDQQTLTSPTLTSDKGNAQLCQSAKQDDLSPPKHKSYGLKIVKDYMTTKSIQETTEARILEDLLSIGDTLCIAICHLFVSLYHCLYLNWQLSIPELSV